MFTKRRAIVILVLIVIFVAVIFAVSYIRSQRNDTAFQKLTSTVSEYWAAQSKSLGITNGTEDDIAKTCYRTEQAAWGNGSLWCRVQVQKTLPSQSDASFMQPLFSALKQTVQSQGFTVHQDGTAPEAKLNSVQFNASKYEDSLHESRCDANIVYTPRNNLSEPKTEYVLYCSRQALHVPPGFRCEAAADRPEDKCPNS